MQNQKSRIKNQESKIDKHIRHIYLYCVYAAMHFIEKGLEVEWFECGGGGKDKISLWEATCLGT